MTVAKSHFSDYITHFPRSRHALLRKRLDCKNALEADQRLKIPGYIWLAFLTPNDIDVGRSARSRRVNKLLGSAKDDADHPERFASCEKCNPLSDRATLALLEILFAVSNSRGISENQYRDWITVANNFGLWKLRYALEDAHFKASNEENYEIFKSVIDKQLFIDHHLVLNVKAIIGNALRSAGLKNFFIVNRRKNIYGVYKKIALKGRSINEIYDIHGFRILMDSEKDCYVALEALHKLWRCIPERLKDYIRHPKPNGYRSIHTVLCCLEGKRIEFQIRTFEMDAIAASGPANHAAYKKESEILAQDPV